MCRIIGVLSNHEDVMSQIVLASVAQNYGAASACGFVVGNSYFRSFNEDGIVHDQLPNIRSSDYPGRIGIGQVSCEKGMKMPVALSKNVFVALDSTKDTANQIIRKLRHCSNYEKTVTDLLRFSAPFAIVLLMPSKIIAARNNGRMPLSFGQLVAEDKKGEKVPSGFYVASQSGVLGSDSEFIHSVFPGEIVVLTSEGYTRRAVLARPDITRCGQEILFYQRADNYCGNREVHNIRLDVGEVVGVKFRRLVRVDRSAEWIGIPVPHGGDDILVGFGKGAQIPVDPGGAIKPKYLRNPQIPIPDDGYTPISDVVQGKHVVIVDDGLIGGRRIEILARRSLEYGAIDCYAAVAALIRSSCNHGKDIVSHLRLDGLCERLHIQKLVSLTPKELTKAIGTPHRIYCGDCLNP